MTWGSIERQYAFQRSKLTIASVDRDVAAGIDYRLRAFRAANVLEPDFRLEFLAGPEEEGVHPPPNVERRPVYDTPAGSVSYCPADDVLEAVFGSVHLAGHLDQGLVRVWSRDYGPEDRYLAVHPLTMIVLSELLKRRDRFSLHAACLAGDRGGLLIAGPSGSGKSTLTLALVRAGLRFLADDMVFLDDTGDGIEAHGFSDAIGVTQDTAARFDELADLAVVPPQPGFRKHLIRIEERFDVRNEQFCRPQFIVFPELVNNAVSALGPMEPQEAWLRLVPDVLLTHPTATQSHLRAIAELTKQVTCYRLRAGNDVSRSAELVGALVR